MLMQQLPSPAHVPQVDGHELSSQAGSSVVQVVMMQELCQGQQHRQVAGRHLQQMLFSADVRMQERRTICLG